MIFACKRFIKCQTVLKKRKAKAKSLVKLAKLNAIPADGEGQCDDVDGDLQCEGNAAVNTAETTRKGTVNAKAKAKPQAKPKAQAAVHFVPLATNEVTVTTTPMKVMPRPAQKCK